MIKFLLDKTGGMGLPILQSSFKFCTWLLENTNHTASWTSLICNHCSPSHQLFCQQLSLSLEALILFWALNHLFL